MMGSDYYMIRFWVSPLHGFQRDALRFYGVSSKAVGANYDQTKTVEHVFMYNKLVCLLAGLSGK